MSFDVLHLSQLPVVLEPLQQQAVVVLLQQALVVQAGGLQGGVAVGRGLRPRPDQGPVGGGHLLTPGVSSSSSPSSFGWGEQPVELVELLR